MTTLLDTANLEKIKEYIDLYPIAGVTTNPSIIAQENTDFLELITAIRDIIGAEKMLHVQVLSQEAEEMIKEAKFINEKVGGNLYIKIPVITEGIKAIKLLNKEGIKTTATAVFTPQQAFLAAQAGASFVAPYVNRIDNISAKGTKVVSEINELFELHNLATQILAASFRNVDQIHNCFLAGSQAITAKPNLIKELVSHPMTDQGVEEFISDWETTYGTGNKAYNL
ncbi:fructose-6-phosphate aldolase [Halanaerocella petrolearia]